jgi:hypothetical protein
LGAFVNEVRPKLDAPTTISFVVLALKTAKFTVEHFPNNYDAWDLLGQVTNNQADRDLAVTNKKRLDPYFEKYSQ